MLATLLILGIGLTPPATMIAMNAGPQLPPPVLAVEQLATDGWQIVGEPLTDWKPAFANPATTSSVVLAKGEQRVGVFIAYYRQQNYARKLISSENQLVKSNDRDWAQVGSGVRQVTLAGQPITVRSGNLRSNIASVGAEPLRLKVWHWYWIDGRVVTSDHLGKLWLALARLSGRGDDSAAIFVYAQEPDGEAVLANYISGAVSPAPTIRDAYTSR